MKAIDRFEKLVNQMDLNELEIMVKGLRIYTLLCIDKKFKKQKRSIIDFALVAKLTYHDRIEKILKEGKGNELPY